MNLDDSQRMAQGQFDRQSERYGREHILADTSDLDASVEGLKMPVTGRALDVATGGGHTALWLARRGYRVSITDISARMLENASRLLEEEGVVHEVAQHAAEEMPYPGRHFEVVTCRVAAHHFTDPAAFVREAARVLTPGGVFVLVDGVSPDDLPEAEAWLHDLERWRDPSHGRFLKPSVWRRLCLNNGLSVVRTEVHRLRQPDLDWYFDVAGTTVENRERVRRLIRDTSRPVREFFRLSTEGGRITWHWPVLRLVAKKPG